MRILVTGCAGFIGSHLCRSLINEGHEVFGIDDLSCGFMDNIKDIDSDQFHFFEIDCRDIMKGSYFHQFKHYGEFNVIYHLAARGETYWCQKNPQKAVDVNINGTLAMLEFANHVNLKHFVFMDTSAEYDGLPFNHKVSLFYPSKEKFAPHNYHVSPKGLYSITKMAASQFVKSWGLEHGFGTTLFRPFNVYGTGMNLDRDIPPVIGSFIKSFKENKSPIIYGDGLKSRDFIFIDDVVDLLKLVLTARIEKTDTQTFNMGTGVTTTILDVYKKVAKSIYEEQRFFRYPVELYEEDKSYEARITQADMTKTKIYFNWEPKVDIDTGIKRTCMKLYYGEGE